MVRTWREYGTTFAIWAGLTLLLALVQSYYAPAPGRTTGGLASASGLFFLQVFALWSAYAAWSNGAFRHPTYDPDALAPCDLVRSIALRFGFCAAGAVLAWANAVRVQAIVYG